MAQDVLSISVLRVPKGLGRESTQPGLRGVRRGCGVQSGVCFQGRSVCEVAEEEMWTGSPASTFFFSSILYPGPLAALGSLTHTANLHSLPSTQSSDSSHRSTFKHPGGGLWPGWEWGEAKCSPLIVPCIFWGHVQGRVSVLWFEERTGRGRRAGRNAQALFPRPGGLGLIPARPGAPWGTRPRGGQTVLLPSALPPPVPTPCLNQNGMCSLWNWMG